MINIRNNFGPHVVLRQTLPPHAVQIAYLNLLSSMLETQTAMSKKHCHSLKKHWFIELLTKLYPCYQAQIFIFNLWVGGRVKRQTERKRQCDPWCLSQSQWVMTAASPECAASAVQNCTQKTFAVTFKLWNANLCRATHPTCWFQWVKRRPCLTAWKLLHPQQRS